MRLPIFTLLFVAICTASSCGAAFAWDVYYDSSVMPNDPSLGSEAWFTWTSSNLSASSVQDGVLHLVNQDISKTAYFRSGWPLPSGTAVTLETCVMIASGTGAIQGGSPATIEVGNLGGCVVLGLLTDQITCDSAAQSVDMTSFHVIRIALQTDNTYQVWLDGTQVFSGSTVRGTQEGHAIRNLPPLRSRAGQLLGLRGLQPGIHPAAIGIRNVAAGPGLPPDEGGAVGWSDRTASPASGALARRRRGLRAIAAAAVMPFVRAGG